MSENFNQNDDSIRPDPTDSESMDPERIIEAIEACRPGSDDAVNESLAFIADHADFVELRCRIEQIDTKIKKVFQDVPVPDGLESRILAALTDAHQAEKSPTAEKPIPADTGPKKTRQYRRWYLGASVVFVAASLLVALFLHMTAAPPLDEWSLIGKAMDDFALTMNGSPLGNQWPTDVEEFQPSPELKLSECKSIHWKKLNNFLKTKGVVYSFTTRDNTQARLYVLEALGTIATLDSIPPQTPQDNTGGVQAAAWQTGDRLYVLVVRGNQDTYRGLLIPPGTLT
ncbi:MAG: hypothetical protein JXM70_27615 [Pirellulales bacterium]|nr:hypothetical protein [Pirellulales bacterium]